MSTPVVAVLGSSGFVGREVCEGLRRRGAVVLPVLAPRLTTPARDLEGLAEQGLTAQCIAGLASQLQGADVVINAAGVADASHGGSDALYGANSLLPLVVAAAVPSGARYVHVSSAAVQGPRRVLDETTETAPFSAYSHSKALAEQALVSFPNAVIFRPTSVHGSGRAVTRRLSDFMAAPWASVAGAGDRPTPQVLVENVGDAIAFTAVEKGQPPRVVLQPSEGLTTGKLVTLLGGRSPKRIPAVIGRLGVKTLSWCGRRSSRLASVGRRVEMLWFGQGQVEGWLASQAWSPVVGEEGWRRLR